MESFVMEDKTMTTSTVRLILALTFLGSLVACAGRTVRLEELSPEKPESAFNEENWDTYSSDQNVRLIANKNNFKKRVKASRQGDKKTATVSR